MKDIDDGEEEICVGEDRDGSEGGWDGGSLEGIFLYGMIIYIIRWGGVRCGGYYIIG